MPYRKEEILDNHFYHIYNRGVNKNKIFYEPRNYDYLYLKMKEKFENVIEVIAYCFMPNHYHMVVKIIDSYLFSDTIKRTFLGYSKAINKSHNRTGHLFEGRYKCKLTTTDDYLLQLTKYIHLNPVQAGLVIKFEDWEYSSYLNYLRIKRDEFIKSDIILSMTESYKQYVAQKDEVMDFDFEE